MVMSLQDVQLKQARKAYMDAADLVHFMKEYAKATACYTRSCEKARTALILKLEFTNGVPLPSGRWGNALALALGINDYISAKYLLENSEKVKLDTITVSTDINGQNPRDLKEEFLASLSTKPSKEESIPYFETVELDKAFQTTLVDNAFRIYYAQESAFKALKETLGVTKEDLKKYGFEESVR
jgi:hypothetical protein